MKHCRLLVRLPNGNTTHTVIITDLDALIAEHGLGKVGKGAKGGKLERERGDKKKQARTKGV